MKQVLNMLSELSKYCRRWYSTSSSIQWQTVGEATVARVLMIDTSDKQHEAVFKHVEQASRYTYIYNKRGIHEILSHKMYRETSYL